VKKFLRIIVTIFSVGLGAGLWVSVVDLRVT